jgi:hypothetical protein
MDGGLTMGTKGRTAYQFRIPPTWETEMERLDFIRRELLPLIRTFGLETLLRALCEQCLADDRVIDEASIRQALVKIERHAAKGTDEKKG